MNQMSPLLLSRQFLVFVCGGLLSALVDIGTMVAILDMRGSALLAATSGFFAGLAVNFLFHARVTFSTSASFPMLLRYLVIVGLNYGLTIGFVWCAELLSVSPVAGKIASLPVVAVIGYLLSKYWAFK